MDALWQDIRFACRSFLKTPSFTLVVLLTLALGIGANVAIFSAVHTVLLRPLPYPESDRLVAFWSRWENEGTLRVSTCGGDFREYQRQATLFDGIAGIGSIRQNVTGGAEPIQIQVGWVTRNLFSVMKVEPMLGRAFEPEEGARSLVLSYGFWQSYFAGERDILGRSVNLDGQPFTIIGVLPADFELLMAANAGISTEIEAWKPPGPAANPTRWESSEAQQLDAPPHRPHEARCDLGSSTSGNGRHRRALEEHVGRSRPHGLSRERRASSSRGGRPRAAHAIDAPRSGRRGVTHRLRERRQPTARASSRTAKRNRGSSCSGRRAEPHCSTTTYRKPPARGSRCCGGNPSRLRGHPVSAGAPTRQVPEARKHRHRRHGVGIHRGCLGPGNGRFRPGPDLPHHTFELERSTDRAEPRRKLRRSISD